MPIKVLKPPPKFFLWPQLNEDVRLGSSLFELLAKRGREKLDGPVAFVGRNPTHTCESDARDPLWKSRCDGERKRTTHRPAGEREAFQRQPIGKFSHVFSPRRHRSSGMWIRSAVARPIDRDQTSRPRCASSFNGPNARAWCTVKEEERRGVRVAPLRERKCSSIAEADNVIPTR